MPDRIIPTQGGEWHPPVGLGQSVANAICAEPLLADDPERRLMLRQADQARDDFAQILDALDFV
jgi:hypothetical protein